MKSDESTNNHKSNIWGPIVNKVYGIGHGYSAKAGVHWRSRNCTWQPDCAKIGEIRRKRENMRKLKSGQKLTNDKSSVQEEIILKWPQILGPSGDWISAFPLVIRNLLASHTNHRHRAFFNCTQVGLARSNREIQISGQTSKSRKLPKPGSPSSKPSRPTSDPGQFLDLFANPNPACVSSLRAHRVWGFRSGAQILISKSRACSSSLCVREDSHARTFFLQMYRLSQLSFWDNCSRLICGS